MSGSHPPSTRPSLPIDAPLDFEHCDSPAGTAAITAVHQDLQPQYGRIYAGGIFTGGGRRTSGFDLRPFFTTDALTTAGNVIDCEGGTTCTSVGFLVDVIFERGNELGVHGAQIRNSASTWQASGTVTPTDFVYPENIVGHLAGSIHVESTVPQVTTDGSFDHSFCLGLVEVGLLKFARLLCDGQLYQAAASATATI